MKREWQGTWFAGSRPSILDGFLAHADQAELLAWRKQTGAKRTFLIHGEEDSMNHLLGDVHGQRDIESEVTEPERPYVG